MIRNFGILLLPHPTTMKKMKTKLRYREGGDGNIYCTIIDGISNAHNIAKSTNQTAPILFVDIMFDEIKLKNGIAYNTSNKKITVFLEETFNTKSLHNLVFL